MVDREEQYVLRVQDKAVAARIRKQLNVDNSKAKLDVRFDGVSRRLRTLASLYDNVVASMITAPQASCCLQLPTVMDEPGSSALVLRSFQSHCLTCHAWWRATRHMTTVTL